MNFLKKKKLLGFIAFCVGLGILFAVTVPTIGWVMFSAICLICVGVFLIRVWDLNMQKSQKARFRAFNYTALWTLPDLKHLVHTCNFCGVPFTIAFTVLMLGSQILRLCLLEWLTLFPEIIPFPQTSQCLAMKYTSFGNEPQITRDILNVPCIHIGLWCEFNNDQCNVLQNLKYNTGLSAKHLILSIIRFVIYFHTFLQHFNFIKTNTFYHNGL